MSIESKGTDTMVASQSHPADSLIERITRLGAPVCVGLDPVLERLPEAIANGDPAEALREFSVGVIDAVATLVPCIKVQAACYERYGAAGVGVMHDCLRHAHASGLSVILDGKRGDIGISAAHYAASMFRHGDVEWATINGYLGIDGMRPFLETGGGAFALVRTSNPSSDELQGLRLADGRTVAEAVANIVATLGSEYMGERGFSALGAVVGATKRDDIRALRERMPNQLFLVPGIGAQGGTIDDVLPCFRADGLGAVLTASRSVIYAFERDDPNWTAGVRDAAGRLADEVGSAVGLR